MRHRSRALTFLLLSKCSRACNRMLTLTSICNNSPGKSSTNCKNNTLQHDCFGRLTRVFDWMEFLSSFPSWHPARSTCARCQDPGEWVPPINSQQHQAAQCSTSNFQQKLSTSNSCFQLFSTLFNSCFQFSQYSHNVKQSEAMQSQRLSIFLDATNSTT